jgi:CubicO group peptidase (beta-lactamase class C family)
MRVSAVLVPLIFIVYSFFLSVDSQANGPEIFSRGFLKKGECQNEITPFREEFFAHSSGTEITGPNTGSPEGQIRQLFSKYSGKDSPGAAIAVVRDGEIVFKNGFGMANLEYDIPITPSTIFHIASVSKQFTTFAILLLEKEGKLSLEDDIRKHLPEVPDFGKIITLRNLATHTSGLRDQWNLLAMAGWRLDDVITREHIIKLVSKQQELNFDPGEEFLYCNTGYTLLAEVVARVSGKTFPEFTEENIFKPLNMTSTLFYDDHEKIVKNRAYSYKSDKNGYRKSVLSYANAGATSLFTTVEDLSLWALNFENPVVGDQALIRKMSQKGVLNSGDTIEYALGQVVGSYRGLTMINHSGADAGYRTYLARFPDQQFSVMVLSNDASCNPGSLALKVAEVYLKDELKPEPRVSLSGDVENTGNPLKLNQGSVTETEQTKPFDKSSVNPNEFTGRFYSGELSTEYVFVVQNNVLIATHPRLGDIKLTPEKAGSFNGDVWFFGTTEFIRDENQSIIGCRVSGGRARKVWFKKVGDL